MTDKGDNSIVESTKYPTGVSWRGGPMTHLQDGLAVGLHKEMPVGRVFELVTQTST